MQFNTRNTLVVLTLMTSLAGCGGSDSSDSSDGDNETPTNQLPTVNAGSDYSLNENTLGQLTGSATDSDGTIVSYQWQQTAGMTVQLEDSNSATTSFTAPDVDTDEPLIFQLTATDNDGGQSSDSVNVKVLNVNEPPIVDAGDNFSVNEGSTATLNGNATDSDGSIASYQWLQILGPEVELENANTASTSFIAPQVSEDTILSFELIVIDNDGAQSSDTLEVSVLNVNNLPAVDAGEDFEIKEGETAKLDGSATDTDGEIESYLWKQISGPEITLNNADTPMASFDAPQVDENTIMLFELTVTDNDNGQAKDSVEVTVLNVNQAPQVDAGSNQTVQKNDLVTLSGTASDTDGEVISYLWQQTEGTAVTLTTPTQLSTEFTVSHISANETLKFSFTATDNEGAQSADSVEVFVDIEDVAPSVSAGDEQLVFAPGQIILTGSATANNGGHIASYQWTQISGTPVNIENVNSEVASFDLPISTTDEVLIFKLIATDNAGASAYATTNVVVSSNALLSELTIPDNELNRCVKYINGNQQLTYVHEVTEVYCKYDVEADNGIVSLEGLEKLFNLRSLTIDDPATIEATQFDRLSNLSALTYLTLDYSSIEDLSGLNNLIMLESLSLRYLNNLKLSELSPINQLVNLRVFDLSGHNLTTNLNFENYNKLEKLVLRGNNIENIQSLSPLHQLNTLWLEDNRVTDISPLSNLQNLTNLEINRNKITTGLNSLYLPNLTKLDVSHNEITDIVNITKNFPVITALNLSNNPLLQVSGISGHQQLVRLDLNETSIKTLPSINDLPKLEEVFIQANPGLTQIDTLSNLPSLVTLRLNDNQLELIPEITNTPEIEEITLSGNIISSIPKLNNMNKLKTLNLLNNQIDSIASDSDLPSLFALDLGNNNISDVNWVTDYVASSWLGLYGNFITDVMILDSINTQTIDLRENNSIPCEQIDELNKTKSILHQCNN